MKSLRYAVAPVAIGVTLLMGAGTANAQAGCFTKTFPGITSCTAFSADLKRNSNNYNVSGCYGLGGKGGGFGVTWYQHR